MGKRFKIAFSFPGEKRAEVAAIAEVVCGLIGKERLFYDRYYEAELARPDLDVYLQHIYHDESELVVVFLCAAYAEKEWCGLEWRAVRDLIKKREHDSIMFVRFDEAEIDGTFSIDGYVDADGREASEVARVIFERYQLNVAKKLAEGGATPLREGATVHNLPSPSIRRLFKGRGGVLGRLKRALGRKKATAITQTIQGLGGIGKTRLAIELGWWVVEKGVCPGVFFVIGETAESLQAGIGALGGADVLGFAGHESKQADEQFEAVMGWLDANPGWLMILDNADDEAAAGVVEAMLGRLARGQVLITSRYRGWSGAVKKEQLGVLDEKAAKAFLLERTAGSRVETGDDERLAGVLAGELGCLALALEQAGAYIVRHGCGLGEYLDEWREERGRVLEWYDEHAMQYPASVAMTWEKTFKMLSVHAKTVLTLSGFLGPEVIPEAMFDKGEEIVAEAVELLDEDDGGGAYRLGEVLGELSAYSMIEREEKGFSVHRIVQEVIRGWIGEDDKRDWIEKALRIVDDYAPGGSDDVRTWPILDVLRPHAETIAQAGDAAGIAEPTARLMSVLGCYLAAKGLFAQAETFSRRALAIDEKSFGKDHPNVATRLNNLAGLLQDTNRLDEAERVYRRVLEIRKKSLGDKHPDYATSLNDLAGLLRTTNRLDEAEPLYHQVLEIYEGSFGNDHPWVATALNNLAGLLQSTNRLDEAEPMYRRALTIGEKSLGKDHPTVAIRLSNLARLLQSTNRVDEAEPMFTRVAKILEKSLGSDHPNVATALNNLAGLLQATNRLDEAEPMYRRALAIDEESLGKDHLNVARDLNNLAGLLQSTNRLDEAEGMYIRAVEILEKSLGAEHPNTIRVRRNLEILRSKM